MPRSPTQQVGVLFPSPPLPPAVPPRRPTQQVRVLFPSPPLPPAVPPRRPTQQVRVLFPSPPLPPLRHVVEHRVEVEVDAAVDVAVGHLPRLPDQLTLVCDDTQLGPGLRRNMRSR